MNDVTKTILVTGFEPFGGSQTNPSQLVALALDGKTVGRCQVKSAVLPVDRTGGPQALLEKMASCHPAAVVCLGEASRRAVVSVEKIAVNWMDFRIPDNQGEKLSDLLIDPEGPAAYFSTLPVREIYEQMLAEGIPAEISMSAGAFLCNQVFYTGLHILATQELAIPMGFIHLPSLPEQASRALSPIASMSLETSLRAVEIALDVIEIRI